MRVRVSPRFLTCGFLAMVELMQKGKFDAGPRAHFESNLHDHLDSSMPCFAALGEQTAVQLRERFQQGITHSLVAEHVDKLIETSLGSSWTRLYDSVSSPTVHHQRLC